MNMTESLFVYEVQISVALKWCFRFPLNIRIRLNIFLYSLYRNVWEILKTKESCIHRINKMNMPIFSTTTSSPMTIKSNDDEFCRVSNTILFTEKEISEYEESWIF